MASACAGIGLLALSRHPALAEVSHCSAGARSVAGAEVVRAGSASDGQATRVHFPGVRPAYVPPIRRRRVLPLPTPWNDEGPEWGELKGSLIILKGTKAAQLFLVTD
jgi:hypothetical protein